MDSDKFASELHARLAAVIPPEVEVTLDGATIAVGKRGTRWGMSFYCGWSEELVADGLEGVLDQVQDEVAENTAEPWPAPTPGPMPESFAYLDGTHLIAGWADPTGPVLTLELIDLRALR